MKTIEKRIQHLEKQKRGYYNIHCEPTKLICHDGTERITTLKQDITQANIDMIFEYPDLKPDTVVKIIYPDGTIEDVLQDYIKEKEEDAKLTDKEREQRTNQFWKQIESDIESMKGWKHAKH